MARFCLEPLTMELDKVDKITLSPALAGIDMTLKLLQTELGNLFDHNATARDQGDRYFSNFTDLFNDSNHDKYYTDAEKISFWSNTTSYVSCFVPPSSSWVTFYITGIVGSLIVLLGIVGNLTLIWSLARKDSFLKRIKSYILILSLCDTLLLVSISSILILNTYIAVGLITMRNTAYLYAQPYTYYMVNTFVTAHVWIAVAISIDRYFAICYPLKHHIAQSVRRSYKICALICLVAAVYNVPRLFDYTVESSESEIKLTYSHVYRTIIYWYTYHIACHSVVNTGGPIGILIFTTYRTLKTVHIQRKERRSLTMASENGPTRKAGRVQETKFLSMPVDETRPVRTASTLSLRPRLATASCNNLPTVKQISEDEELTLMPHKPTRSSISSIGFTPNTTKQVTAPTNSDSRKFADRRSLLQQSVMVTPVLTIICYSIPCIRDVCFSLARFNLSSNLMLYINAAFTLVIPLNAGLSFYAYLICSARYRVHCWRKLRSYFNTTAT